MRRLLRKTLDAKNDIEVVHDLRVCTRRTEAALVLFKPLIAKKRRKWMRRRLRRIRSVAGVVRDCDVHWKHLNDEAPNALLLRSVMRERREARKELRRLQKRLLHRHQFAKQARKLVRKLNETQCLEKAHRNYPAFARRSLDKQATRYFQSAAFVGTDDKALHALRIAAKRWRYSLELATGVLEKPWAKDLYEQLSEVQDRLGALHDLEALCQRIEKSLALEKSEQRRDMLTQALAQQRGELAELRQQLGHWWTAERREQLAGCWRRASGHLKTTA